MKKQMILVCCMILAGISLTAQTFYIRSGPGVAVSTAAGVYESYNRSSNSTDYDITTKKRGFGTGVPIVLSAGYKFNSNLGVELGIDYFSGFGIKWDHEATSYSISGKEHAMMLSLVPALVATFPMGNLHPYGRLGLKLGIVNQMIEKVDETSTSEYYGFTTLHYRVRDYGGLAIGIQGALGTDYKLTDHISLFGEIQLDGISYSPRHGKYTEYTEDGLDQLATMTVKEKSWDYKKKYTSQYSGPSDEPAQYGRTNYSFSNAGIILGVKFSFGKEKQEQVQQAEKRDEKNTYRESPSNEITTAPTQASTTKKMPVDTTGMCLTAKGDSKKYYKANGSLWGSLLITGLTNPVFGLIFTPILAFTNPSNLQIPYGDDNAKNSEYLSCYRKQAKKTKIRKAWTGFGIGVGIYAAAITVLLMSAK